MASIPNGNGNGNGNSNVGLQPDLPRRTYQAVVAATRDMGISKDGKMPWNLPSDLKFFQEITTTTSDSGKKNAVVMGRKTWESIPPEKRPLSGRLNVVLTRSGSFDIATAENVVICGSLSSAMELLAASPYCLSIEKVFLTGGGEIFREALNAPGCEAVHITEIEERIECDTFIPQIDTSMFQPWYSYFPLVEDNIRYSFTTFVRVRNSALESLSQNTHSDFDNSSDSRKFEVQKFSFLPKMIFERHEEYKYLRLVQEIISEGTTKDDRTGTGTLSKFGCQYFGVGLLKSFSGLSVVQQVLSISLTDREEGDLGPVYGFQWRHFDLVPGDFIHVIGDAHVYRNHVRPLQEQLQNHPKPFPILKINPKKKDIDSFVAADFNLIGYDPHQKIEMKMAV
ncbi:hypothetical protein Ahy_A03g016314 isoform B [Arachis hypogaea]|uniref:DHFR domain-containing protein n=1 Tax=Arachis hypogaea TaxID=3818 RepID=A0A445E327_ARAHY|nr:hypothetical protein Ahy_A03g016314 isoform A [Arachis hypogaea]RYR69763.1 hypothetical protein Ahy_A03g016314 isoform B [Arachis hypogaea]